MRLGDLLLRCLRLWGRGWFGSIRGDSRGGREDGVLRLRSWLWWRVPREVSDAQGGELLLPALEEVKSAISTNKTKQNNQYRNVSVWMYLRTCIWKANEGVGRYHEQCILAADWRATETGGRIRLCVGIKMTQKPGGSP